MRLRGYVVYDWGMKRLEIPTGAEYGDLTVILELESPGKRCFACRCICGNEVEVRLDHLRSGHSESCGRCGVEYGGRRQTVAQWAREYDLNESTLRARLKVMGLGEALERK